MLNGHGSRGRNSPSRPRRAQRRRSGVGSCTTRRWVLGPCRGNNGSLDNLKVSSSHGLRPNAFQMRLIVGLGHLPPKYGRDSEPSRLGHQGASLEAEHSRSDHRATGVDCDPTGRLGHQVKYSRRVPCLLSSSGRGLLTWPDGKSRLSSAVGSSTITLLPSIGDRQGLVDCSDVGRLTSQKGANKANENVRSLESSSQSA